MCPGSSVVSTVSRKNLDDRRQGAKVILPTSHRKNYERNSKVSRFCTTVQDRDVVVAPSATLERQVHEIIDNLIQERFQPGF